MSPLLRDWLRGQAGFEGVIISDYNAIAELIRHGVAGDLVEAAALALKAGVDIDMVSGAYPARPADRARARPRRNGGDRRGDVAGSALKERLGLFDDPYRRGASAARRDASRTAARRELAREAARRAIVVLTNSGVLPLAARRPPHRRRRPAGRTRAPRCADRGRRPASPTIPSRSSRACASRCPIARSRSPKAWRSTARMSTASPGRSPRAGRPMWSCWRLAKRRR